MTSSELSFLCECRRFSMLNRSDYSENEGGQGAAGERDNEIIPMMIVFWIVSK